MTEAEREKQDSQRFWLSLLHDVYGMENAMQNVQFERRVIVDGQQKYIDAYLPETKVMACFHYSTA